MRPIGQGIAQAGHEPACQTLAQGWLLSAVQPFQQADGAQQAAVSTRLRRSRRRARRTLVMASSIQPSG